MSVKPERSAVTAADHAFIHTHACNSEAASAPANAQLTTKTAVESFSFILGDMKRLWVPA